MNRVVRPLRGFGGSLYAYAPVGYLGDEDLNCAFSGIGCGSEVFYGAWLWNVALGSTSVVLWGMIGGMM